jgi:Ecdysteroid kinase-like family
MNYNETVERITGRFNEDQLKKPLVYSASEIPISYESITVEWLTEVLCSKVPGAEVISYKLDEVDDGSSNRRRLFITYNSDGKVAGLPESVFCKAAQKLLNRVMLTISKSAEIECNFYNYLRPRIDICASNAYFANFDEESGTCIIMLEDIAKDSTFCDHRTPVDFGRACQQMITLAKLHGFTYQPPDFATFEQNFLTWPKLIEAHLKLGLAEAADKGFVAAGERGIIPERLFKRRSEVWPRTIQCIEDHDHLPRMMTHNDVHLKNWYTLNKTGEMGLSDWQTVSIGNWSRDVSYAIATALTIENRRNWENDLLRFYLEKLLEFGGPNVNFNDAWKLYRQQLFAALYFWTQTLTPSDQQPDMQPEDTTVEFLSRIGAAVDDLDALDSFDN